MSYTRFKNKQKRIRIALGYSIGALIAGMGCGGIGLAIGALIKMMF
jgi:hypothetical protein